VLKIVRKHPVDFPFLNKALKRSLVFLLCLYLFVVYEIWNDLIAGRESYILNNIIVAFMPIVILIVIFFIIFFKQLKLANYSKAKSMFLLIVGWIAILPFLLLLFAQ